MTGKREEQKQEQEQARSGGKTGEGDQGRIDERTAKAQEEAAKERAKNRGYQ